MVARDLDLEPFASRLHGARLDGSAFLGCSATDALAGVIVKKGGVFIPDLEGFAFSSHRAFLYGPDEIFAGFDPQNPEGHRHTFDHRVYEEYLAQGKNQPSSILVSLARRLHDHSITDAIRSEIEGRRVVAVMGGHGMERSDPFYQKVAHLSRTLTQHGFLMVTGGGPGAMEATHLGAYFAKRSLDDLDAAIERIGIRPPGAPSNQEYADPDWLHRAWAIREAYPLSEEEAVAGKSIGIPTWLYGHEPPAVFATHIAKYFDNSVREDGLLAIATYGVVYAPGSAGTTQEIFQDATQNHYGTVGIISPMILFGRDHWTKKRPVWPLLKEVAQGKMYGELLALTDDEDEIVRRIRMFDPKLYTQD